MTTPDKIDLAVLHKAGHVAPRKPVLLDLKQATYLAISGRGEPGGTVFSAKVGALYAVAYTVKMTRKFGGQPDYTISRLEAQWWAEDGQCFASLPKDKWCWRLLIRTPEFVAAEELKQAVAVLLQKGKPAEVEEVQLENFVEGPCVQMLHVGPYEREGDTVALMEAFARKQGLVFHGHHHEIYLSDPRRIAPEKLKTILRRPVKPA